MNLNDPEIFGDNPVLDILHITYADLTRARFTELSRMESLMLSNYKGYSRTQLRNLIKVIAKEGNWFRTAGNRQVHITEEGVEVYLNMIQLYKTQKHAEAADKSSKQADRKMVWSIVIATLSLFATLFGIYFQNQHPDTPPIGNSKTTITNQDPNTVVAGKAATVKK